MDHKDFEDYNFAEITKEELSEISDLELQLSKKNNKNIVLIAYQPKDNDETRPSLS